MSTMKNSVGKDRYKQAFQQADTDDDGVITATEVVIAMSILGKSTNVQEVEELMTNVSRRRDGKIDMPQFLVVMYKKHKRAVDEELFRDAFKVLDINNDGFITRRRLREVADEYELGFTDDDITDMIEEVEPRADGKVGLQDVMDLFNDSHETINSAAVKKWLEIKSKAPENTRVNSKPGSSIGALLHPNKLAIKKLPGKKVSKRETQKRERFNKLSLTPRQEKAKPVRKPGLTIRERRSVDGTQSETRAHNGYTDTEYSEHELNDSVSIDSRRASKVRVSKVAKPRRTRGNVSVESEPVLSEFTEDNEDMESLHAQRDKFNGERHNGEPDRTSMTERKPSVKAKPVRKTRSSRQVDDDFNDGSGSRHGVGVDDYNSYGEASPTSSRKMAVHERLYDPNYRDKRTVSSAPEEVFVRDFKSKPPRNLEHVTSRHMDPQYFEPRGEYVLEEKEEGPSPFRSKPPKGMEHVQSKHLNPEYFKKKEQSDGSHEQYDTQFHARVPKNMENVQSRILDPKYFEERRYEEPNVAYNTEFKARLPKNLEHVQSRLLEPIRTKNQDESDDVYQTAFRAKPPKKLEHVESRILNPIYFEPRPTYELQNEEPQQQFKAHIPKYLPQVDARIYDERYFKKKVPPISSEEQEAQNVNRDFKARLPKNLKHVQSRAFDPAYNKALSPRLESPQQMEVKKRGGSVVVINVKKDGDGRRPNGYKDKMEMEKSKDKNYYIQWRKEFNDAVRDIRADPKEEARKSPKHEKTGTTGGKNTGSKHNHHQQQQQQEEQVKPEEKPQKKPFKPKKKHVEKIDRSYFDSWVMTPTHIYRNDHSQDDMFYRNRQNVNHMWSSLARTVNESPVNERGRVRSVDRHYY